MSDLAVFQTGISARTALEGAIAQDEQEFWLLTDELIRYYLQDSTTVGGLDSAISLLKAYPRPGMACQYIAAQIKAGHYSQAQADLDSVASVQDWTQTEGYYQVLELLLTRLQNGADSLFLSSSETTLLHLLALEDHTRGAAQARALLKLIMDEDYPELIETINNWELPQQRPVQALDGLEAERSKEPMATQAKPVLCRLYPNPFTGRFYLELDPSVQNQKLELVVYNALGQPVEYLHLAQETAIIEIKTAHWASGIYYYQVLGNGKLLKSGLLQQQP